MPISEEDIMDFARQLAASENGCACSGEDLPEPSSEQYEYARERLLKESKLAAEKSQIPGKVR